MLVVAAKVGELTDSCAVDVGFGELEDVVVVFVVHGEDEIESLKIMEAKLSGIAGDLVTAPSEGFGHAGIRLLSRVKADGAGGVALDSVGKPCFFDDMAEDVVARRGSADVAHTNENEIIAVFHETNAKTALVPMTGKES